MTREYHARNISSKDNKAKPFHLKNTLQNIFSKQNNKMLTATSTEVSSRNRNQIITFQLLQVKGIQQTISH